MKKNRMRPVPPGEILSEEFLKPLGLTANAPAKAIGDRITRIKRPWKSHTVLHTSPPLCQTAKIKIRPRTASNV